VVVWIVIGTVALGVLIMGLTLRAFYVRRAPLMRQQAKLQRTMAKAQELAEVAHGLQAHADSLRLRADLVNQQVAEIKKKARANQPGPA
jgi:hypothetical protein